MSPWEGLLRSRKFLLVVMDGVTSLLLLLAGRLLIPDDALFVAAVIGIAQPVWIAAIGAIAWEDAAAKRGGYFVDDSEKESTKPSGYWQERE